MTARRVSDSNPESTPLRAATTPERRENQLINLAVEQAEKLLMEGKAPAQVLIHYIKAGSSREYLEQQRIAMEVELLRAKQELMASNAKIETLYEDAIAAMRAYQGAPVVKPEEDV